MIFKSVRNHILAAINHPHVHGYQIGENQISAQYRHKPSHEEGSMVIWHLAKKYLLKGVQNVSYEQYLVSCKANSLNDKYTCKG